MCILLMSLDLSLRQFRTDLLSIYYLFLYLLKPQETIFLLGEIGEKNGKKY